MQDADTPAAESEAFADAFGAPEAVTPTADDGGVRNDDGGAQPRDESGRFASKTEAGEEPAAGNEQQPTARAEPEKDHRIPIRELLDERDRRQAAERRLQEFEREREAWLRQQQQASQRPDPIADPDGYAEYVQEALGSGVKSIEEQFRDWRVNMTFADAHEQHGEKFEAAYSALQQAPMEQRRTVMDAINPAKALMQWHSRQRAQAEVGDDLDGFLARKREEWLNDPAVREQVLAWAREEAGGRSSTTVTDFPSLNRAPGSAGQRPGTSEPEVFQSAFGSRRR